VESAFLSLEDEMTTLPDLDYLDALDRRMGELAPHRATWADWVKGGSS